MFDFDDDLESRILANEYQDSSAKGFLTSNIGKQMLDSFLTAEEDESTVKIGAPLYCPEVITEDVGKVKISDSKTSNFSVKFTSSPDRSDSDSIESISKPQTQIKSSIPQPADVIRDLFLGKHTWIGQFRKLSEKHELLQLALKTHDKNTIYSILSHLRLTLNPTVLFETLNQFPKSKIHYFTYLKEKGLVQELINTTHACKDFEKCGLLKLSQARKTTDPYKQALMLKECIDYLKKTGLDELAELALDESELLESQLSIHTHEKSVGMSQESIGSIEIFSPVLRTPNYTTLYYLCLRHFDSTAGDSCPTNFQTQFKLTNKEFLWIALSARAQLKDWQSVDSLLKQFQAKSFFGLGKSNTLVIPPEDILEIFYSKDPTAWGAKANELRDSLIVSLLNQTEDLEVRCSLSLDYLCHPVVIETLVKLKDKARLEDYVTKVPAFSKFRKLIGDKLASKSITWKNV